MKKHQIKIKDFKATTLWLFKTFAGLFQIWKFWKRLIIYLEKSASFTIFSILLFLYCFGCHNFPFSIQFSKLLILLLPLFFNFWSIWHPKTLSFQCLQNHHQIPSSYISWLKYDAMLLSPLLRIKKTGQQKLPYYFNPFLNK